MTEADAVDDPVNRLYYGDCLTIMQSMAPQSVDLIYLDPPFNSNRDYCAIYKEETGRPLPVQVEAFSDMWTLDGERERVIRDMPVLMREAGVDDAEAEFWRSVLNGLRKPDERLAAYLSYMTERLLPLKNILKPSGSIYLHCDPTASHYIKLMMDAVFGRNNFCNEIIWHYQTGGASKRFYAKKHDTLYFYGAKNEYTFKPQEIPFPRTEKSMQRAQNPAGARISADNETKLPMDVWADIPALNPMSKEREGYPTQKPLALLERIIKASSNEGDVVFDPFCGCATTIVAAHTLKRKWVGIDIAIHAVKRVANSRLSKLGLIEGEDYKLLGVPNSLESAHDLWARDPYHFQKWAVEQTDGFVTEKQTADGGIDGRLYFDVPGGGGLQSMVIEVKGGANVGIDVVRSLLGVMKRDEAAMAGLILMDEPSPRKRASFEREMAAAEDLHIPDSRRRIPRMQMLTVPEILEGKRFDTPSAPRGRGDRSPGLPGIGKPR